MMATAPAGSKHVRLADYGLTHGDFLLENLLRDGDTVLIIDFDDCGFGFGWHVMDVATSLTFLT